MDQEDMQDPPEGMEPGLNMEAMEVWNMVIDDMEATAEDLSDAGWSTLQLHPGDVVVPTNIERPGIDAVLPDAEFERLEELVEGGIRFTEYDVFKAGNEEVEYALVVAKDHDEEAALLLPLYYRVQTLAEVAYGKENIPLYLRRLDDTTIVIELTEPELLLPDAEAE